MTFIKMLRRMGYIEQCRPPFLFRAAFNEKLRMKIGPLDVRKLLDEIVDGRGAGDVVERVNIESPDEGLGQFTVRTGNDGIEAASPEDVGQGYSFSEVIEVFGFDAPPDAKRAIAYA